MENIRVRFAPSPTGPLHIGGVRTALYNYLIARKHNGTFILRIEDTDQERFVPGAEQYIIDSLAWCGLQVNEGPHVGGPYAPYRQSERKHLYRQYVEQLIASGHAYYAFDTKEEVDQMRDRFTKEGIASPKYDAFTRQYMKNSLTLTEEVVKEKLAAGQAFVVRIKVPQDEEVRFVDEIRGEVSFQSNLLDDKVLFKSDGMPTYHMANVVDDYLMKITHVIRGEEWLSSAPTHVLLYRFLGWEKVMPKFAHLPLILRPDGNGKLSKRDGDRLGFPVFPLNFRDQDTGEITATGFREKGFLPEAFINMLAFLGWNPGTEQELFSMEELIEAFSIERINKSGAKFDFEKAKWFNQQYLKKLAPETMAQMLQPILMEKGIERPPHFLTEVCRLMAERITFLEDIWTNGRFFFELPEAYDEKTIEKKWPPKKEVLLKLLPLLEATDDYSAAGLEQTLKAWMSEQSLGPGDVLPVLRIALTGTMQGPAVFETAALLGKEETLKRLGTSFDRFG